MNRIETTTRTRKMEATRIVYERVEDKPRTFAENIKIPDLKDGEILGKILSATICGSDMHTLGGKRNEASPSVLGHEGIIEVVKSNRKMFGLKEGDRATFHIADCCKNCTLCRSGLQQKCEQLFKYGHSKIGSRSTELNGCYASHILLLAGTHVVKIPDNVPSNIAAPLNCAMATMVNATSCVPPKMKVSALVQGAGLLGLYGCVILKELGYESVYCSEVNKTRLSLVSLFGGIPVGPDDNHLIADQSIDIVIEVCGVPDVFKEGMRVLKPGGVYVLVGMVHPLSKLDITGEQIIRKCMTIAGSLDARVKESVSSSIPCTCRLLANLCLSPFSWAMKMATTKANQEATRARDAGCNRPFNDLDKGVHNYSSQHLDEAVDILARTVNKYPYSKLISPSYKLSQFEEALEEAMKQSYLRVVVEP